MNGNNNFVITPPFAGQTMSLDSSPYSDSPNNVDQLFSSYFPTFIPNQSVNSITPPNIFEFAVDSDYDYFNNAPLGNEDMNLAVFTDSIRKLSQLDPEVYVATDYTGIANPNLEQISQPDIQRQLAHLDTTKFMVLAHTESQPVIELEQGQPMSVGRNGNEGFGDVKRDSDASIGNQAKMVTGGPLPNAKISNVAFKVLQHPENIKLLFTRKANKFQPDPKLYTLQLHQPDWTRRNNEDLWTVTLGEALVLHHAFFSFFVDRGLCVILKVCDNSVKSSSSVSCFTSESKRS